jgi:hypothetical protein
VEPGAIVEAKGGLLDETEGTPIIKMIDDKKGGNQPGLGHSAVLRIRSGTEGSRKVGELTTVRAALPIRVLAEGLQYSKCQLSG